MEKITYGAPRLVDWVAQIKAGAATVRVHFTGGALTAYGVTPAEYTTNNPFIQKVIEQSAYFKEGRIIKLRETDMPEPAKTVKAQKAKAQKPKQEAQKAPVFTDYMAGVDQRSKNMMVEYNLDTDGEVAVSDEEQAEETAEAEDEAEGGLTKVEVSCLQDAQAYLQENYGIASWKVRSYESAQRAAMEHGVEFVGSKFSATDIGEPSEGETE